MARSGDLWQLHSSRQRDRASSRCASGPTADVRMPPHHPASLAPPVIEITQSGLICHPAGHCMCCMLCHQTTYMCACMRVCVHACVHAQPFRPQQASDCDRFDEGIGDRLVTVQHSSACSMHRECARNQTAGPLDTLLRCFARQCGVTECQALAYCPVVLSTSTW